MNRNPNKEKHKIKKADSYGIRMAAKESIENLYKTFKKYELKGRIEKCPCGCISYENEQRIYSKPLRSLEVDDLGFYNGKAMTTWGNQEDYKHFLPRIIEIYKEDRSNGWITLETIHNKLKYANWKEWLLEEQKQITDFVEIDWKELVNKSETEIWIEDFESYLNFFDLEELLEMWELSDNKTALRNFIHFFYMHGNRMLKLGKNKKLQEEQNRNKFFMMVERIHLTTTLEEAFFSHEKSDEAFADKISIVLQIIEHEMKHIRAGK